MLDLTEQPVQQEQQGDAGSDGATGPTGATGILGTSSAVLAKNGSVTGVTAGTVIQFDEDLLYDGGEDIVFTTPSQEIMLKENNVYLVSFTALFKASGATPTNVSMGLKLNGTTTVGSTVTQDQASNEYYMSISNTSIVHTHGQSAPSQLQFCVLQNTIDFYGSLQDPSVVITIIKIA
ncbi:hypothetical protein ACT7C9_08480 [Bacillus cereus]